MKFILEYTVVEEDLEKYLQNIIKYSKMYTRNKYIIIIFMFFFGIFVANLIIGPQTIFQSLGRGIFSSLATFILFKLTAYSTEKKRLQKYKDLLLGERFFFVSEKGFTIALKNSNNRGKLINKYEELTENEPQIKWNEVQYFTRDDNYIFFYLPRYKVVMIKSESQLDIFEDILIRKKINKKK